MLCETESGLTEAIKEADSRQGQGQDFEVGKAQEMHGIDARTMTLPREEGRLVGKDMKDF